MLLLFNTIGYIIIYDFKERTKCGVYSDVLEDSEEVYLTIEASILSLSLVANASNRTPFL